MEMKIDTHAWVYVLVQKSGNEDQIVGQADAENRISFIPMFMDKESAQHGTFHLAKEKGKKFEIQAIIFEDLEKYALENQFILFVVDDEGKVIDKRVPGAASRK